LGNPDTYVRMETGRPDGFLFDAEGNIVIAAVGRGEAAGDIQTYDGNGKLIDVFSPGPNRRYTNVALSADRKMVITDTDGSAVLIVDDWPYAGLALHPFRRVESEVAI